MRNKIFFLIIGLIGFVISCKEEETDSTIVLNSFGPSGVKHGETVKFIGMNLDRVTSIMLPGVEVSASSFTTRTSRLVELTVPNDAEAGLVVLKTPDGDITTKTPLSFDVPVVVSSFTSEAKPGTEITITGSFVNWLEEVTFNDGVSTTEFTSKSLQEVKLKVPMAAQSGFLIFRTGGTDPETFTSTEEISITLPTVSSVAPEAVRHTEAVTITGTDLDLITSVTFAGDKTTATFDSQSETELVVKVPSGSIKGNIVLHQASPVDVTTSDELAIILPAGTSLTPKLAAVGENITIGGTNLELVKQLIFPPKQVVDVADFISQSATEIVVTIPDGTEPGAVAYLTIHDYTNNLGVAVGAGPDPLPISLFDDAPAPGGGNWSWDGTSETASTEQFFSGEVSWKFSTDKGGGMSVGGITAINASGMTHFTFALYGGPGTDGMQVATILNDNWNDYNAVTLVEGEWTTYQIDLSEYPTTDLSKIVRFAFKVESTPSVIYVDWVGFD